jgi:predicted TIM-barrel fold metal-dependent hydrolase
MLPSFVDAHQHFQDIESHYYLWLGDEDAVAKLEGDLTAIRRNYLPVTYR